jgi:hypothetical protein
MLLAYHTADADNSGSADSPSFDGLNHTASGCCQPQVELLQRGCMEQAGMLIEPGTIFAIGSSSSAIGLMGRVA